MGVAGTFEKPRPAVERSRLPADPVCLSLFFQVSLAVAVSERDIPADDARPECFAPRTNHRSRKIDREYALDRGNRPRQRLHGEAVIPVSFAVRAVRNERRGNETVLLQKKSGEPGFEIAVRGSSQYRAARDSSAAPAKWLIQLEDWEVIWFHAT